MRVELPSGNWCDLREPRTVSEKACRPVRRAMGHLSAEGRDALSEAARKEQEARDAGSPVTINPDLSEDDVDALWELNDQLAVALVESWSLADPITLDTITGMPRGDYETLVAAVAPLFAEMFFDKGSPVDPKVTDPTSSESVSL